MVLLINFFIKYIKNQEKFNIEKIKANITINFWKLDEITSRPSDGKKPPPDTNVIVKLRELKSLTPEIFNRVRIKNLRHSKI